MRNTRIRTLSDLQLTLRVHGSGSLLVVEDVLEGDVLDLDLVADEVALEEDIMYQIRGPWLDQV